MGESSRESGFVAIIATGACAAMIFNTLPLFLGAAADAHQLGHAATGWLGSLYLGAFGISSVAAAFWMGRTDRRVLALWLFVGAAAFLALAGMSDGWVLFVAMVFGAGLLLGALYSLSFVIAGERPNPTRAFGIKLLSEVLLGAALLAFIPLFILPGFGMGGILMTFAAVALASALCVPWIARRASPSAGPPLSEPAMPPGLTKAAVAGLAALFVFTIGQSALWSFTERRAAAAGFDASAIGAALSAAAFTGGLGSLAAAWVAERLGRIKPLLMAALLQASAIALFAAGDALRTFVVAINLFMFAWLFALPYMTSAVSALDPSGRATSLVAACLAFGSMAGPGLAGQLVAGGGFGWLYAGAAMAAFAAYVGFGWLLRSGTAVGRTG